MIFFLCYAYVQGRRPRGLGEGRPGDGSPRTANQSIDQPHIPGAIGKAQIKPLILRKCQSLGDGLQKTMDALTKALMELEESGRECLTIQCGMARLPILEDFVIDLGPALRVCRPALAIEKRLDSMEKTISVMEEAVSTPLPTSSRPRSPAAPAQDHPLSQAPQSPQGEAPISVAAPLQPWRRPSVEGQPQWLPPTQHWPAPSSLSKTSWEPRTPTTGTSTPRRRRRRGCRAGRQVRSRRQREGPEPAPRAPSPAIDDSTVLSDAPEVLNDPLCAAGAEMGPNQPSSAPQKELMELTTAAEPQSPVKDPFHFRDVCSGVKETEKDAQCTPSGTEQAEEATTKEQGTVATCPCPEEAPKTAQDMLAINPSPVEAPQPALPRSLHRLQQLWGFIARECYDLI